MCDLTPDQLTTFPDSRFSPLHARAFVREHACPEHGRAALDALMLVTSELVTNAVLCGAPPILVRLTCLGSEIHVTVGDTGIEPPGGQGAFAGSPIGLLVVADVADEWGTTMLVSGKEVWCRVATGVGRRRFGRRSTGPHERWQ